MLKVIDDFVLKKNCNFLLKVVVEMLGSILALFKSVHIWLRERVKNNPLGV